MANFYATYAKSSSTSGSSTIVAPIGQTTMSASVSVAIASDQSPVPTTQSGSAGVQLIRNVYSSTNVTSGAYVQLVASTAAAINKLYIFDSSGAALALAVGAPASEVQKVYVFPGGVPSVVALNIPIASRISIISIDTATVSTGQLLITALG